VVDTHAKALQINLDAHRYGTFAEIGGKLASTTWHGTYLITADGYAPLKGKTCSFPNIGAVRSKGASVKFTATGAMTK